MDKNPRALIPCSRYMREREKEDVNVRLDPFGGAIPCKSY